MATNEQLSSGDLHFEKHLSFINEQINFHTLKAEEFSKYPKRATKHISTAGALKSLRSYLLELHEQVEEPKSSTTTKENSFVLTMKELEGLPEELREELSIKADSADYAIMEVISSYGGTASLDQILIGLYRATGEVNKRTAMTNRLYRMAQREQIFSYPGKKGVYSLEPKEDTEQLELRERMLLLDEVDMDMND